MRIILLLAVLALPLFVGCRKSSETYGNFAKVESVELVQDAVTVLLSTYPPAKTRLNFLQTTDDSFGLRLVESMRGNGYAIAESVAPAKGRKALAVSEQPPGLGFAYVLDRLKDGDELRVTLYVGDESISRIYAIKNANGNYSYVPNGYWVRKQ
jgi:hypothetical protein